MYSTTLINDYHRYTRCEGCSLEIISIYKILWGRRSLISELKNSWSMVVYLSKRCGPWDRYNLITYSLLCRLKWLIVNAGTSGTVIWQVPRLQIRDLIKPDTHTIRSRARRHDGMIHTLMDLNPRSLAS